jgi:hypothetical protein
MYNGVKAMIEREQELNPHKEEEIKSEAIICGP